MASPLAKTVLVAALSIALGLPACKKAADPAPLPIKEAATDSLDLVVGGVPRRYAVETAFATVGGHRYFNFNLSSYHGRLDSTHACLVQQFGMSVPADNHLAAGLYVLANRSAFFHYVDCDAPYARYEGVANNRNQTFLSVLNVDEAAGKVRLNFGAQLYILPGDDPYHYAQGLPDTVYVAGGPMVVPLPK